MTIDRGELTALDAYRLYLPTDEDGSTWGFCLEAARITKTNDIMVLFRNDEEGGKEKKLRWLPLSSLCTKNQASLSYQVEYTGPTEEVMFEILRLIRDAFEFAADTDWYYQKRLEFYHAFPFEELHTREAVHKFRPVLFSCRAFTESIYIDKTTPKNE